METGGNAKENSLRESKDMQIKKCCRNQKTEGQENNYGNYEYGAIMLSETEGNTEEYKGIRG